MGNSTSDTKQRHQILLLGSHDGDESTIIDLLKNGEVQTELESPYKVYGLQEKNVSYKGVYVWYPPGLAEGGRCTDRVFLPMFFRNAIAVVYVINSTDSQKIEYAKYELAEYREDRILKDALIIAIASKQDHPDAKSPEQLEEILNEGQECPIKVFPAVVDTGDGINECFDWLIGKVTVQHDVTEPLKDVAIDVMQDGKAGINSLKGAWKKVVSKFRCDSSKIA